MTTIAADLKAGLMVSDTQWNDGAEKGQTRKVYRINGELIGFAGDLQWRIRLANKAPRSGYPNSAVEVTCHDQGLMAGDAMLRD